MNRQLDHMVRLIDDLLDVSRISRGTLEIEERAVEPRRVDRHARIETARPLFERRGQSVAVERRAPLLGVGRPDAHRRRSSATSCTTPPSSRPQGGTDPVELAARRRRGDRVIDNGVGHPAPIRSSASSRCSRGRAHGDRAAARARHRPGAGAAARRAARRHAGGGQRRRRTRHRLSRVRPRRRRRLGRSPRHVPAGWRPGGRRSTLDILRRRGQRGRRRHAGAWLEAMGHRVPLPSTGPRGSR